ncbi:LPXTG cell wall anchor domain-containing protein [Lactobacillus helsingborgensis]
MLFTDNGRHEKLPQTGTNQHSQITMLLLGFMAVIGSLFSNCFSKKKKD